MKIARRVIIASGILGFTIAGLAYYGLIYANPNPAHKIGQIIDRYDGVAVYYNGGVGNVSGRNLTEDGYNLGLRYQCVEFIKRYYYEHFAHKMPDSYGHAKDFFDDSLPAYSWNPKRALWQYRNGGMIPPQVRHIIVFGSSLYNPYGHVAIISEVTETDIEIVQQNPGPFAPSRERFPLSVKDNQWHIGHHLVKGWLGLPPSRSPSSG